MTKKKVHIEKAKKEEIVRREGIFVTGDGVKLKIRGLPALTVQAIEKAFPAPEYPLYQVTTAAGTIEEFEHDETTLEVPDDPVQTEENERIWARYIKRRQENDENLSAALTKLIIADCVLLDEDNKEAIDLVSFIGLKVPKSKHERVAASVSHLLRSADDVTNLITSVMKISGVDMEAVAAAEESFQDILEGDTSSEAGEEAAEGELEA